MKKVLILTACVLLVALFAHFETVVAGGTTDGAADDLDGITVRSGRFPSGAVTLKNGEYREPVAPGSAVSMVVKLTNFHVFGAVNGRDAAAVVIVTDLGGSGVFFDLALLFKEKGAWINVDTVFLGDRIKVHSVDIRDKEFLIGMTVHSPRDALCCPTLDITRRFAIEGDHLVAHNEEKKNVVSEHEIVGPVWHWVRTRYANDTMLKPASSTAGYALQLKPDGSIQVRGECNAAGGTFILRDSKLTITITHTTLAACPEGSLENVFIRDLNKTGGFVLENGMLFLDLRLDSGTMEFHE